ncbi:MAG: tyrosine-type recombinase/integrase [Vicinamibacterales bacterium]
MSVKVRPYRRGGWEVDIQWFAPDGRRRRERRRVAVTARSAAVRWGEARERELLVKGPSVIPKEVPRFQEFVPRFLDGHARANRQKPGGIAQKETVLRVHLVPQFGTKRLSAIGNEDVQRLKHHLRTKAPRTVNNVLTVLSMMLKKAVEWDVIDRLPCTVRLLKVPHDTADFYDFTEFDELVRVAAVVSAQAAVVVLLGGEAGLRAGEMRALEWPDISFVKQQVRVARNDWRGHVTTTKGDRERHVPLTARLLAALQVHRHLRGDRVLTQADGSPLAEHMLTDLLRRVARRANLRYCGVHVLRHTFCSHLAMRGAPMRAIQELAGHRDLSTTQRYMHLSPSALTDAIRLLERPAPTSGRGDILETAQA